MTTTRFRSNLPAMGPLLYEALWTMFVALGCGSLLVAWQILQPYLWWRDAQIWISDTYGRFPADTEADTVLDRLIDYGEPEQTA